jgi:uncharacterized protein YeaO (DUF488 family)
MLKIKRAYDPAEPEDGSRILVDRLWPRGLTKEEARIDDWRKDISPSAELRTWFGHDPVKWEDFRKRYRMELERAGKLDDLAKIGRESQTTDITLVFAAKDIEHSHAKFLQELIRELSRKKLSV